MTICLVKHGLICFILHICSHGNIGKSSKRKRSESCFESSHTSSTSATFHRSSTYHPSSSSCPSSNHPRNSTCFTRKIHHLPRNSTSPKNSKSPKSSMSPSCSSPYQNKRSNLDQHSIHQHSSYRTFHVHHLEDHHTLTRSRHFLQQTPKLGPYHRSEF